MNNHLSLLLLRILVHADYHPKIENFGMLSAFVNVYLHCKQKKKKQEKLTFHRRDILHTMAGANSYFFSRVQ